MSEALTDKPGELHILKYSYTTLDVRLRERERERGGGKLEGRRVKMTDRSTEGQTGGSVGPKGQLHST